MAAPPSAAPASIDTAMVDRVFMMVLQWELQLLGFRLLVAGRLLRGLKLIHGLLQPGHGAFERDNLGVGRAQLLRGLERVLVHEPLQKVDVALKAPRSLVEPCGFVQSSIPAISCARAASAATIIRLKPSTTILTMLLLFVASRSRSQLSRWRWRMLGSLSLPSRDARRLWR